MIHGVRFRLGALAALLAICCLRLALRGRETARQHSCDAVRFAAQSQIGHWDVQMGRFPTWVLDDTVCEKQNKEFGMSCKGAAWNAFHNSAIFVVGDSTAEWTQYGLNQLATGDWSIGYDGEGDVPNYMCGFEKRRREAAAANMSAADRKQIWDDAAKLGYIHTTKPMSLPSQHCPAAPQFSVVKHNSACDHWPPVDFPNWNCRTACREDADSAERPWCEADKHGMNSFKLQISPETSTLFIVVHGSGLHRGMNPSCAMQDWVDWVNERIPELLKQYPRLQIHLILRSVVPPDEVSKAKYIDANSGKYRGQGADLAEQQGTRNVMKFDQLLWDHVQRLWCSVGMSKQPVTLTYLNVMNVVQQANHAVRHDAEHPCSSQHGTYSRNGTLEDGRFLASCDGTHAHNMTQLRMTQLLLNTMRLLKKHEGHTEIFDNTTLHGQYHRAACQLGMLAPTELVEASVFPHFTIWRSRWLFRIAQSLFRTSYYLVFISKIVVLTLIAWFVRSLCTFVLIRVNLSSKMEKGL